MVLCIDVKNTTPHGVRNLQLLSKKPAIGDNTLANVEKTTYEDWQITLDDICILVLFSEATFVGF